jgi:hypothetical protein
MEKSMSHSLNGVIVKKANQKETYTEEQIAELLKCMDHEKGYLHFAENFAYIQHPVKGKLLFAPYEYQKKLLESYHTHRFNINMLPRQSGKCFLSTTFIRVKNKNTGQEQDITIGEFFDMQKTKNNKKSVK